jgi:hypothetical protein
MRGHRLALAALVLAAAGCDTYYYKVPSPDDLLRAIPWFDHMVRAKYIHPYSRGDVPRQTVEGTVPVGGEEADWAAEWAGG